MKKVIVRAKWLIVAGILLALACVVAYAVFHHYHPTHYRFNDYEVIGHTVEEIIDRYGEPDTRYHGEKLNYMGYKVKERYITSWGLKYPAVYYVVHFENGDGIASRVSLEQYGGLDWL